MKALKQLPCALLAQSIARSLLCVLGMAEPTTTSQRTSHGTPQVGSSGAASLWVTECGCAVSSVTVSGPNGGYGRGSVRREGQREGAVRG